MATGDGRVMAHLLAKRRDLKLIGTDLAPRLPEPPRGTRLKAGVSMEELPFPDNRFAAVTSQFGFEYADMSIAARELARVLVQGGLIGLLMHRPDSPILEHNLRRRRQIEWALKEKNVLAMAQRHLQIRATGLSAIPEQIRAIAQEGHRRFGAGSAAWEIPEAVAQTLELGATDHAANVAAILRRITEQAENEMGRIASLEKACHKAGDAGALNSAFENAGLVIQQENEVCAPGESRAFATFRVLKARCE
ncbi:class I SAM-dependent methyltransferase [Erythrobacter litoralis]|uniref:class I SAM-dependent methyltransferase n=1 Tax=Erythrobacter litoralis TaxID=39960 RepID=UPI003D6DD3D6